MHYELRLWISHLHGVKFKEWVVVRQYKERGEAMQGYEEMLEQYDDDFQWELVYCAGDGAATRLRPREGE